MGPFGGARAEAAWWRGDRVRVLEEVSGVYELARRAEDSWQLGLIVFWIWRAGGEISREDRQAFRDRIPLCYLAMIEGDSRTAAAEWERIGCPYERAMALAEGDQEAQFQAFAIFEKLGVNTRAAASSRAIRMGIGETQKW